MLSDYIRTVMAQAQYRVIAEDDTIYGEVPGFDGVHAQADTLECCRHDLAEALEEWVFFRVSRKLPVPEMGEAQLPAQIFPEF
jgi:predicted RNase H-like HicB family nuclease